MFWVVEGVHPETTFAKECPKSFVYQGAWRFRVTGEWRGWGLGNKKRSQIVVI